VRIDSNYMALLSVGSFSCSDTRLTANSALFCIAVTESVGSKTTGVVFLRCIIIIDGNSETNHTKSLFIFISVTSRFLYCGPNWFA
jgi:hypothetical protein